MRNYLVSMRAITVFTVAALTYIVYIMSAYVPLLKPVSVSGSKFHCQHFEKTSKDLLVQKSPPWFSGKILYVWPEKVAKLRLGNRLFNYASTFGIAWRNRRLPILPSNIKAQPMYDLTEFFHIRIPVDRDDSIIKNPDTRAIKIKENGPMVYDDKFEQLPERNVSLWWTWLQSYKYFEHIEDQLRIDLTFKGNILDNARRWLSDRTPERWRDAEFVRVLIHVRRQDYANPILERRGWTQPTMDYFRRSMSYFTDCLERVQFVVLSDDPAWCRKHLHAKDILYPVKHSPIMDLAIASLCDHAIITIGSFGWWAAWFANGITITQKNMPRNGSFISKRLHRNDHYKPEWIGL